MIIFHVPATTTGSNVNDTICAAIQRSGATQPLHRQNRIISRSYEEERHKEECGHKLHGSPLVKVKARNLPPAVKRGDL